MEPLDKAAAYPRQLAVAVEVVGEEAISPLDMFKGIVLNCGTMTGCRIKGRNKYEVTMKDMEGKKKLLDGLRIQNCRLIASEPCRDELTVSFLSLPVYIEDSEIIKKLEDWGVTVVSPIKRRKWPGTDILDGTRFCRVKFNERVRSLPFATKFSTLEGEEYFKVMHDRQVKVCRLCIQPGHILRECPEFKCFSCGAQGHYARECHQSSDPAGDEEMSEASIQAEAVSMEEEEGQRPQNVRIPTAARKEDEEQSPGSSGSGSGTTRGEPEKRATCGGTVVETGTQGADTALTIGDDGGQREVREDGASETAELKRKRSNGSEESVEEVTAGREDETTGEDTVNESKNDIVDKRTNHGEERGRRVIDGFKVIEGIWGEERELEVCGATTSRTRESLKDVLSKGEKGNGGGGRDEGNITAFPSEESDKGQEETNGRTADRKETKKLIRLM